MGTQCILRVCVLTCSVTNITIDEFDNATILEVTEV